MNYYLTALSLMAGVCAAFGGLYLYSGLRRKSDKELSLLFGVFALSCAGYSLTAMSEYSATSLAEWMPAHRWFGVFVPAAFISLIWYVALYTSVRPRALLWLLTAAFVAAGIAHLTGPNLIHQEILGMNTVTLPWGEQLATVEATESIWELVLMVASLTTIGYLVVACVLAIRRRQPRPAVLLSIGVAWFLMTVVGDMLFDFGILPLHPGDFGFLGLAVVMSLQITNGVIRAEEKVARHADELEELVGKRTRKLGELNEFLALEITERRQAEKALQDSVEELALLNAISKTLTTAPDLRSALEEVTELVAGWFEACFTAILLPSSEDTELQIAAGFIRESGTIAARQFPVPLTEMPQTQQVLGNGESVILPDVQSLPLSAPLREFATEHNVHSVMLVPLLRRGAAVGVMTVALDRSDHALTADELSVAETIAGDVAVAVENARLSKEAQTVAVTEERDRLARELHDAVTQALFSASLIAEALPGTWERDRDRGQQLLEELRLLSRGALAEMRTLLLELRPARLLQTDLTQLLQQLAEAAMSRQAVSVEVTGNGECSLPPDLHIALYRIAQEGLTNAVRHAQPNRVEVHLECVGRPPGEGQARQPQRVELFVHDDGCGFDPGNVPPDHLGLSIIQERADAVGADLTIDSRPGHGTRIAVIWDAGSDPRAGQ